MKSGETQAYYGESFHPGLAPGYDYPYAPADSILVGKGGPELEAWGGACAVALCYDRPDTLGGIVHFDISDIERKRFEELIRAIAEEIPPRKTRVFVFSNLDEGDSEKEQWLNDIVHFFEHTGFQQTTLKTGRSGQDVFLDMTSGAVHVDDDNGEEIYLGTLG